MHLPTFPRDGEPPSLSWGEFLTALIDLAATCYKMRPYGLLDVFFTIDEIRIILGKPDNFQMQPLIDHPGARPVDDSNEAYDHWFKRCQMYKDQEVILQSLKQVFFDSLGRVPRMLVDPKGQGILRMDCQDAVQKMKNKYALLTSKDIKALMQDLKEPFVPGHHDATDFLSKHCKIHLKLEEGKAALSDFAKIENLEIALTPSGLFTRPFQLLRDTHPHVPDQTFDAILVLLENHISNNLIGATTGSAGYAGLASNPAAHDSHSGTSDFAAAEERIMDRVASILEMQHHALMATLGQQHQQQQQQQQQQPRYARQYNRGGNRPQPRTTGSLSSPGYCWTHGWCKHTSKDCQSRATNHDERATLTSKRGGSTRNCPST